MWLWGDHTLAIAPSNWFSDATTSILLYSMTWEITHDKWIALVSQLLFAFCIPGMCYSWQAIGEPLFGLFLAAFALSFPIALRLLPVRGFVVAGVSPGMASLARSTMLYCLPLAMVMVARLLSKQGKHVIGWIAARLFHMSSPWLLAQYAHMPSLVSLSLVNQI